MLVPIFVLWRDKDIPVLFTFLFDLSVFLFGVVTEGTGDKLSLLILSPSGFASFTLSNNLLRPIFETFLILIDLI